MGAEARVLGHGGIRAVAPPQPRLKICASLLPQAWNWMPAPPSTAVAQRSACRAYRVSPRRENCWAGLPLQFAIWMTVPGVVAPQAASMQRPFVRMVPSAVTTHIWFGALVHGCRV